MGIQIQHTIARDNRLPRELIPSLPPHVGGDLRALEDTIVPAYASIGKVTGITGGIKKAVAKIDIWDSPEKRFRIGEDRQDFIPVTGTGPDWTAQAWINAKLREPYASGEDVFEEGQQ